MTRAVTLSYEDAALFGRKLADVGPQTPDEEAAYQRLADALDEAEAECAATAVMDGPAGPEFGAALAGLFPDPVIIGPSGKIAYRVRKRAEEADDA